MRGSRRLLRAQVHSATDTKPLSSFSNPNCFVKAILGDGDGSNLSNIYECRKNHEKESYLCDLELNQRSCAAEPTLYRNMRFLDLGARDCYLTTSASSLQSFSHELNQNFYQTSSKSTRTTQKYQRSVRHFEQMNFYKQIYMYVFEYIYVHICLLSDVTVIFLIFQFLSIIY